MQKRAQNLYLRQSLIPLVGPRDGNPQFHAGIPSIWIGVYLVCQNLPFLESTSMRYIPGFDLSACQGYAMGPPWFRLSYDRHKTWLLSGTSSSRLAA